jgi:carbon storage regulator CsrA
MLVLSRKHLESVVVGGPGGSEPMLVVTVLEINGGSVRLGFAADADVAIHRREVWERIHPGSLLESPEGLPPAPVG